MSGSYFGYLLGRNAFCNNVSLPWERAGGWTQVPLHTKQPLLSHIEPFLPDSYVASGGEGGSKEAFSTPSFSEGVSPRAFSHGAHFDSPAWPLKGTQVSSASVVGSLLSRLNGAQVMGPCSSTPWSSPEFPQCPRVESTGV